MIERAVRGVELGLKKDAAIGYGLQRGGTFIWEAKSDEQLNTKEKKEKMMSLYKESHISRSTLE